MAQWHLFGTPISGMRMALALGFLTNAVCWVLSFTLRPIKVEEEEEKEDAQPQAQEGKAQAKLQTLGKMESNPITIIRDGATHRGGLYE